MMNQENAMQPVQDEVMAGSTTAPSGDGQQKTSAKSKPEKAKAQAPAKAASGKAVVKSKAATPPAKPSAKTETPAVITKQPSAKAVKKPVAEPKAETATTPKELKAAKVKKPTAKKPKLVRDSFTIPESDYALFATLKQRAIKAGIEIKKGELLRASIVLLSTLGDAEFVSAISAIERIKTGRPKK